MRGPYLEAGPADPRGLQGDSSRWSPFMVNTSRGRLGPVGAKINPQPASSRRDVTAEACPHGDARLTSAQVSGGKRTPRRSKVTQHHIGQLTLSSSAYPSDLKDGEACLEDSGPAGTRREVWTSQTTGASETDDGVWTKSCGVRKTTRDVQVRHAGRRKPVSLVPRGRAPALESLDLLTPTWMEQARSRGPD